VHCVTCSNNVCDIKANTGNPVCISNKMTHFLFLLFSVYITYTAVAIPVRMSMYSLILKLKVICGQWIQNSRTVRMQ
jgi:hypothetical protein